MSDTSPAKYVMAWKDGGHLGRLTTNVWLVADKADAFVFWEGQRGDDRELAEEFEGGGRGGLPGLAGVEIGYRGEGRFG